MSVKGDTPVYARELPVFLSHCVMLSYGPAGSAVGYWIEDPVLT